MGKEGQTTPPYIHGLGSGIELVTPLTPHTRTHSIARTNDEKTAVDRARIDRVRVTPPYFHTPSATPPSPHTLANTNRNSRSPFPNPQPPVRRPGPANRHRASEVGARRFKSIQGGGKILSSVLTWPDLTRCTKTNERIRPTSLPRFAHTVTQRFRTPVLVSHAKGHPPPAGARQATVRSFRSSDGKDPHPWKNGWAGEVDSRLCAAARSHRFGNG